MSDDAALAVCRDRASYATVLVEFMQRGVRGAGWQGVPMARYGRQEARIHRILDGTSLSRGAPRWSLAAILAVGSPLAYVTAAMHPQGASQAPAPSAVAVQAPAPSAGNSRDGSAGQSTAASKPNSAPSYLVGLGTVAPFYTVTVRSRVEGQLVSLGFKEGDVVQAGQLLATIDDTPYQLQVTRAEEQLSADQAQLDAAIRVNKQGTAVVQLEPSVRADRANVENAKRQLSYTKIVAPIRGVTGLRAVDPGNMVRLSDTIVIINQTQPIAVVFTIPEEQLPKVLARVREGVSIPAEAWDRAMARKYGTGHLTAVDNMIDSDGMAKLKAILDNKDGVLFPGQFVNVRLLLNAR